MCVPALSPSVPTAVFLKLSLDPLPVLSNPCPSPPTAQAFPLACVLQVGVEETCTPLALTIVLASQWPLLPGRRPALLPEPAAPLQDLPFPDGVT